MVFYATSPILVRFTCLQIQKLDHACLHCYLYLSG